MGHAVVLDRAGSFVRELRTETAELHTAVEAVCDLPGSVETRKDYGELLSTFHAAHRQIERALGADELVPHWRELGIDLAQHRQLDRLTQDLRALRIRPDRAVPSRLVLSHPAEALGCLYVIEGSALGRRVLAPLLKEKVGEVPSRFFDGGAGQAHAWRDVQRALQSAAHDPARQQEIICGARLAFGIFLDVFGRRAAQRNVSRR